MGKHNDIMNNTQSPWAGLTPERNIQSGEPGCDQHIYIFKGVVLSTIFSSDDRLVLGQQVSCILVNGIICISVLPLYLISTLALQAQHMYNFISWQS